MPETERRVTIKGTGYEITFSESKDGAELKPVACKLRAQKVLIDSGTLLRPAEEGEEPTPIGTIPNAACVQAPDGMWMLKQGSYATYYDQRREAILHRIAVAVIESVSAVL